MRMSMMRVACVVVALVCGVWGGAWGQAKKVAGPAWKIVLTQIDKAGTVIGAPFSFDCTASGCEQFLILDVDGKPLKFLVTFNFAAKGAYLALQSLEPGVRAVIEFEKDFVGPQFLGVRPDAAFNRVMRYTLVGSALQQSEASSPQLMPSGRGNVFHRKLVPDLTLKLAMQPVAAKAKEAEPAKEPEG